MSTQTMTETGSTDRFRAKLQSMSGVLLMSLGPVVAAFILSGIILLILDVNPFSYYGYVFGRGLLSPTGVQATLTRMGPLLLIAAALIVAFRAGIWNLGGDAQFLIGAVFCAAWTPLMAPHVPVWLGLLAGAAISAVFGGIWALVPAFLRAYQGLNEIITTLMMNFLGISFASVLVKLVFLDPTTTVPQTRTLAVDDRLPTLFGTTISSGLVIGLIAILGVHFMMTRTAFGLRLRVVGGNASAAVHAGLAVPLLTVAVFAISGALAGLSGGVAILGQYGNVRADWNPGYSLAVVPLVFLARFNGFAAIGFVALFSILSIGAESAARRTGIPNYFTLVTIGILLVMLAISEYYGAKRQKAGA
ncbi:putative B6 ABC transporter permease subunit 2 [Celeribacter litoreus]|uniref:putative B6 ABC transporter permease subunit 2 n=1 Tax=Celeribacter litoreus TaxID=2876714 RepID=UPI001CCCF3CE|nr:ABC transporter permease [Celeribacter litoreus]MCA0042475.1 ABC transporter permease [Celeribacter litoreus]